MTAKAMRVGLVGVLPAFLLASSGGAFTAQQATPEETVAELLSLRHGLNWGSGEANVEALLSRVRADPPSHVPLLLREFDAARDDPRREQLGRAQVAANALVKAGGEVARAELAKRLNDLLVATASTQAELSARESELAKDDAPGLEALRDARLHTELKTELGLGGVEAFMRAGDSRLVPVVLRVLGRYGRGARLVLYAYLRVTARGQVAVADELETRWATTTSPIGDDPQLTATLLVIRRSAPPTVPPATPSARVERLLRVPPGVPPDPQDAVTLSEVVADPGPHLAALERALGDYDPVAVEGVEEIMDFESAVALMSALDTARSADQLGAWFIRLDEATNDEAREGQRVTLLSLRASVLKALGKQAPVAVKEYIVANLSRMSPASRRNIYGYLMRCCVGDPVVADGLRPMCETKPDSLRDDPGFTALCRQVDEEATAEDRR